MNCVGALSVAAALVFPAAARAQACDDFAGARALDPVSGNLPIVAGCGASGWCMQNYPMGARLNAIWANADNDVWAVGGPTGIAFHWDGASWSFFDVPAGELRSVWGSGPGDVWAVGKAGALAHWDGSAWSLVPSPATDDLLAVSGSAPSDVWATGLNVALHWDGSAWMADPSWAPVSMGHYYGGVALYDVDSNDVFATHTTGCRRFDGASWSDTPCQVQGGSGVWASSPSDVWAVGATDYGPGGVYGYRSHWDGSNWAAQVGLPGQPFHTVVGFSPSDVWIDGLEHWDGASWSRPSCGAPHLASAGSPQGTLFGVAGGGVVQGAPGAVAWLGATSRSFRFAGGASPTDQWVLGADHTLVRSDGTSFTGVSTGEAGFYAHRAWGSSSSDVWALGSTGLRGELALHFDGTQWSEPPGIDFGNGEEIHAGWTTGPADGIAVGANYRTAAKLAWRWNGASWESIPSPFGTDEITGFWGSAADDVWAIGTRGYGSARRSVLYKNDGTGWSLAFLAERDLMVLKISGTTRGDVWFVTYDNRVMHWIGFRIDDSLGMVYAISVGGSAPDDVWMTAYPPAGGDTTDLWHYDGNTWTKSLPLGRASAFLWSMPGVGTLAATESGGLYYRR